MKKTELISVRKATVGCWVKVAGCVAAWNSGFRRADPRNGILVYFADPSPWQRGSNENANGYLSKVTDLSVRSQEELDAITHQLHSRSRAVLGCKMPIEVFAEH